jgi:hypothetical protein
MVSTIELALRFLLWVGKYIPNAALWRYGFVAGNKNQWPIIRFIFPNLGHLDLINALHFDR